MKDTLQVLYWLTFGFIPEWIHVMRQANINKVSAISKHPKHSLHAKDLVMLLVVLVIFAIVLYMKHYGIGFIAVNINVNMPISVYN